MPRKPKKAQRRVVAVIWDDAAFDHDHDEHGDLEPIRAITYGEIVELNDKHIKVASEVFKDGSRRQHTSIPRGMVVGIIQGFVEDPFQEDVK